MGTVWPYYTQKVFTELSPPTVNGRIKNRKGLGGLGLVDPGLCDGNLPSSKLFLF